MLLVIAPTIGAGLSLTWFPDMSAHTDSDQVPDTDIPTMDKHCPYCKHLLHVEIGAKSGSCDRCSKNYEVKYHLTKIKLIKLFVPRDYEADIMAYITRKGKGYAGEISYNIGASKGVVSVALKNLEDHGLLEVVPRGKTKWVKIPGSDVKIR